MQAGLAVPFFPADMRLDADAFAVLGVGSALGRQVAHALRQFGARVWCCDRQVSEAQSVAFEVKGRALACDPAAQPRHDGWDGEVLRGVVDVLDDERLRMLDRQGAHIALAASLGMAREATGGEGVLVLAASTGDPARAEALHGVVDELTEELAEYGLRVHGIVVPPESTQAGGGMIAFLCARLGRALHSQVLRVDAPESGEGERA